MGGLKRGKPRRGEPGGGGRGSIADANVEDRCTDFSGSHGGEATVTAA